MRENQHSERETKKKREKRQTDCYWQCRPENGRKWKWLAVKIGVPGKCHLEAYALLNERTAESQQRVERLAKKK